MFLLEWMQELKFKTVNLVDETSQLVGYPTWQNAGKRVEKPK